MSKVMRSVKNVTKGYSSVQVKVRNATSNDPWGPTGTDMSDIAQMTYNSSTDFFEIMDMLDKRLNDKGKNWRHVLKALKVLDYALHEGSELVVTWAKKNVYIIKTLREFQYIDEDGRDVGQNVRVSAKELTSLILDEERLKSERKDRKTWKSRVTGIEEFGPDLGSGGSPNPSRRRPERRDRRADEEETEYRLAIEASKAEAEEEQRRRQKASAPPDDDDLQKALKLSKEEEELRRRELEESNANALFDDTPALTNPVQFTGANQGYTQQPAVDWFGNPIGNQTTGYLNNVYNPNMQGQPTGYQQNQPTGFQPQPTGYQNGFSNGFPQQQPQPTGFDAQQTFGNGMNQGQPGFGQQPQSGFDAFGAQAQPQQDLAPPLATGTNNPWGSSKPAHDTLAPVPTGSNNPFASSFTRPQPSQPTLSTLSEQKVQTQFNNLSLNPPVSFSPPPPQTFQPQAQPQPPKEQNPHHAQLNALLAAGEGQDTFGNVGNQRIPAQHTAPGTFVNSAGQGLDRLHANQTGNNPFFNQQQFTGGPQQQQGYGLANAAGLGQNRLAPAQTGPAAGFGGSPSPFGGSQAQNPYQRPAAGPGGNSLIDL